MEGQEPGNPPESSAPAYTIGEEVANALTHGLGAVLSVVALVLLVTLASIEASLFRVFVLGLYGCTLVLLYLASTLYHAVRHHRAKRVFQLCDHAAIFLLIAGTYTPYALIALGGASGWVLFAVVWTGAVTGVAFKIVCRDRYERAFLALYLGLGWIGVIALGPMLARLEPTGALLLVAGGLIYTTGVVFYVWERMPFSHAVWHVFVLAGSACHFLSIYYYVAPAAV